MQLSLGLDEYVVFDLETTGLSPWAGAEILEIGAMKVFGADVDETQVFHSMVKPKRIIPPDATQVNGITNEMVADAPPIEEVIPRFIEYIGGAWLVAQNAKFDMNFMVKALSDLKMKRELEVYDTMIFSRRCFPGEYRHNLDVICQRLGLQYDKASRHRSMADVTLTAKAFVQLKERLGDKCPNRERWVI